MKHFAPMFALFFLAAAGANAATPACDAAKQKYEELRSRSAMDEAQYASTAEAESVRRFCGEPSRTAPAAAAASVSVGPAAPPVSPPASSVGTTPASPLELLRPPANTTLQPPANTSLQPPANTTLQPPANTSLQPPANTILQPAGAARPAPPPAGAAKR